MGQVRTAGQSRGLYTVRKPTYMGYTKQDRLGFSSKPRPGVSESLRPDHNSTNREAEEPPTKTKDRFESRNADAAHPLC